jgi:hypothetical protein
VSGVAVVLVVALVVLIVFLFQKRRISSPFKHRRMAEAGRPRSNNMEFANRMFLQDDDESEEHSAFTMEETNTNFVNPVYETMFQDSRSPIIREKSTADQSTALNTSSNEKTGLLCTGGNEKTGLLCTGSIEGALGNGHTFIHTDSD